MKKSIRINNELVNTRNFTSKIVTSNGGADKYFAIVAKCGHCGMGRYIPILFEVRARDKDAAIDIIRNIPRVKSDNKEVILFLTEITYREYLLINAINRHDPYLRSGTRKNAEYKNRFIVDEHPSRFCDKRRLLKDLKTSSDFSSSQILQKYFAPNYVGDKLVYPHKVSNNGREMLEEYYTYHAARIGFNADVGDRWHVLAYYYQVFGPNNKLGVKFENDCLSYTKDDKYNCMLVSGPRKKHLANLEPTSYMPQVEQTETLFEEPYSPAENSQIEKFNAKWRNPMSR